MHYHPDNALQTKNRKGAKHCTDPQKLDQKI